MIKKSAVYFPGTISMNLYHTELSELYKEIETLSNPLTGISDRIDFKLIRPMYPNLYVNDTEEAKRPNYYPIQTVKILLLQLWYHSILQALSSVSPRGCTIFSVPPCKGLKVNILLIT